MFALIIFTTRFIFFSFSSLYVQICKLIELTVVRNDDNMLVFDDNTYKFELKLNEGTLHVSEIVIE